MTMIGGAMAPTLAEGRDPTTSARSHLAWLRGREQRHDLRRAWPEWFERHDLLLCPVMATPAFPHDHTATIMDRTVEVDGTTRGHIELISWLGLIGVLGLPSAVVPIGRTAAGLPVGMQIVAPWYHELPRHPCRRAHDRRARWLRVAARVLSGPVAAVELVEAARHPREDAGRGWSPP